ncbi:hypothetical protein EVAR_93289_1 [Eumeta japonica]|uniref:Major facilitator superfamily (MFS) profile domain-containing protein n=1 Tax=Eumeta variegata TaxID=151549 RepID=A0A4C1UU17_EUMVA|nr:hypothetical protein EVAR_93289_1 [Eumeta japonica]
MPESHSRSHACLFRSYGASGGARRRRRRRPPTASRLKGPRKQKSFAYKLLKRGLANLMSPTSTSGVAPPLYGATTSILLLFIAVHDDHHEIRGRIAELLSAKWVMFFSVAINVLCTLLTPVMAELHFAAMVLMRIGEGIGGGVTFPAMHVLLSKWAPPAERGVLAALVYAGTSLGTVLSMLMAGILTQNLGWASVFYVMGGLSCIWCILWIILIQDSPQQQPMISIEERTMIVTALGGKTDDHGHKKLPIPWRAVVTSPPFLAILVAHICSNWGWYMLLIELPFYMNQVLKFDIAKNAITTSLPFLSLWIFSMVLSKTLDWLRSRKIITMTTARKIGTLFASLVPMVCMLGLCYVGCNERAAVALMAIGVTCIGGMFCGFLSNHIDIAPNFAGTLMAITNTFATIPGIVVPIFVGHLTHTDDLGAPTAISGNSKSRETSRFSDDVDTTVSYHYGF